MKKLAIVAVLACLCCFPSQPTRASGEGTAAWNAVCASWEFASYPQGSSDTFEDAFNNYGGSHFMTFSTAFAGVKAAWAERRQISTPEWDGGDLINTTLEGS